MAVLYGKPLIQIAHGSQFLRKDGAYKPRNVQVLG